MLKKFQNKYKALQILFVAGVCLFSCTKDFIEPNIGSKTITLLAPADGLQSSALSYTFLWDSLPGAEKYNVQIVTPNFSSIAKLVLDTNITKNKFSYTLSPGSYQWRVKGINNGGSTAYSVFSLKIDSTSNLSGQTVVLVSPASNFFTQTPLHTFKWDTLYNATEYRVQIINSANATILDVSVTKDSLQYSLPGEGKYTWQVRAQNSISNSPYSSRIITLDSTAPVVSTPVLPANGDSSHSPVTISWTPSIGSTGDSLFINTDSLFVQPMAYTGYTTSTSYSFTTGVIGKKYYWRLRTTDAAGNWSGYSTKRRFKVW